MRSDLWSHQKNKILFFSLSIINRTKKIVIHPKKRITKRFVILRVRFIENGTQWLSRKGERLMGRFVLFFVEEKMMIFLCGIDWAH